MISIDFEGNFYKDGILYNGWYDQGIYADEYYINGKCVVQRFNGSNKYTILYDHKLQVNSREEAERVLKLLVYI